MQKGRRYSGPLPNPRFAQQVSDIALPPLVDCLSGEVTASVGGRPLGLARFDGSIVAVNLSCKVSGKDDSNDLYFEADVRINDTTVFTTKPQIAHVSGEAAQQKTTYEEAADTGITSAVINASAAEFSAGDVIEWDFLITRTASPTTEIADPCIMVELRPNS